MIGHILRHKNEPINYKITKRKSEGKRGPRTSKNFMCQTNDLRLPMLDYVELKRLVGNRDQRRAHIQLQNQPKGAAYKKNNAINKSYYTCSFIAGVNGVILNGDKRSIRRYTFRMEYTVRVSVVYPKRTRCRPDISIQTEPMYYVTSAQYSLYHC